MIATLCSMLKCFGCKQKQKQKTTLRMIYKVKKKKSYNTKEECKEEIPSLGRGWRG